MRRACSDDLGSWAKLWELGPGMMGGAARERREWLVGLVCGTEGGMRQLRAQ